MSLVRDAAGRQTVEFWVIFSFSCLIEALWFLFINLGFFSDTLQYLSFADELRRHLLPHFGPSMPGTDFAVNSIARRTLGYPLLLIFGGVPQTGSFIGVLILQAVMAIAMPVLTYKIIELYSRRAAFITAVVLIVSLEPFNYSKAISSDHTFKFLLLLLVFLVVRTYHTPTRGLFCAISVTSIMLMFVRMQGGITVFLVFGLLLIAHPRRFVTLATHFVGVGITLSLYWLLVSAYLASYVPTEIPNSLQVRDRSVVDEIKTLLLYHAYYSEIDGAPALEADRGPVRDQLRSELQTYAERHVQDWSRIGPAHYFSAFKDDPIKLVNNVYQDPNPFYLNLIKLAAASSGERIATGNSGENLLSRVIWETYKSEPRLIISFITRFLSGSAASTGGQQAWSQYYTTGLSPFRQDNGPASQEIVDLLKICFHDPGCLNEQWQNYPGGEDKMIADVFTTEHGETQWYALWEIMDRLKGRLETGRIFLKSLAEFPDIYRLKALLLNDKLAEILVGTPSTYRIGKRYYDDGALFLFTFDTLKVSTRMKGEITTGIQPAIFHNLIRENSHYASIVQWYTGLWLALRDLANLSAIATILFCFFIGTGWSATLMAAIVISNAAVVAFAADSYIRYIDYSLPVSITLAGLTVTAFLRVARRLTIAKSNSEATKSPDNSSER